jgi:cytochrome P450
VAKEAVSLFGLKLEARQSMFIPRQAYNRDPARFDAPDLFDVNRPERRHLSFSYGAHFCLGQAVARTNLQEGLRVFLDRCRDLELVEEPKRVPFTPDEQLESLRIQFRAQENK